MQILVVGGNGGIGFSLIKTILARFPEAQVTGTYRRHQPNYYHPRFHWERLDITLESEITALAAQFDRLDWLINAAGILHNAEHQPEKTIATFDECWFLQTLKINTMSSLLLARHFQGALKKSGAGIFAAISARVGSIEDNQLGGWYSYRMSKAALNMALKTLSIEWRRKVPGCCVALLHPGTTESALSEPFQKNVPEGKLFSADKSAGLMLGVLEKLSPDQTGRFWAYDGSEIPW